MCSIVSDAAQHSISIEFCAEYTIFEKVAKHPNNQRKSKYVSTTETDAMELICRNGKMIFGIECVEFIVCQLRLNEQA